MNNKYMNKGGRLLALGAMVGALLAGCSGGGSGDTGTTYIPPTIPTYTPPPTAPATTFTGTPGQISAPPVPATVSNPATTIGNPTLASAPVPAGTSATGGLINSASNYVEMTVQHSLNLQPNSRQSLDCFTNSGTNTSTVMFSFVSPYVGANAYIMTQASTQTWVNGAACTNCVVSSFVGQSGYHTVNIAPGTYCVAVENTTATAKNAGYEVTPLVSEGFVGWFFSAYTLDVSQNLQPGGWFAQPFSLSPNTRVVLDGLNSGGNVYLVAAADIGLVQSTNAGATGTFRYLIQTNGALICSMGGSLDQGAPEDCAGLEQYISPGNYYLVFANPATNTVPVQFTAYAMEFR